MSYRVVLRAHTTRRDIAPAVLVERMLQHLGCQTFIACVRNFEWVLKWWQPHAVVVMAPGAAARAKELRPDAQIIFLDGEGFQSEDISTVTLWKEKPALYTSLDLCLLWGPIIRQHMQKLAPEFDQSITHIVGNPKFDPIRFMPDTVRPKDESNSIGILGRFPSINHHQDYPTIRNLHTEVNLNFVISICRAYHVIHKVIEKILTETDYKISFRPHPMEQVESYRKWILPSFGKQFGERFEVDDSLVVTDWIVQQRCLIAPTSTAFLEAYLLQVPTINIDHLAGTADYNANYAQVCAEWQAASYQPKSLDEAVELVVQASKLDVYNSIIENQIADYCAWQEGGSASWNAARLIVEQLRTTQSPNHKHFPRAMINARDSVSFWRAMHRDPLHHNFNYKEGFHKVPTYYDEMINTVIQTA